MITWFYFVLEIRGPERNLSSISKDYSPAGGRKKESRDDSSLIMHRLCD